MEIYRTPLSPMFIGKTFGDVAELIYNRFGAILVGVEKTTSRQEFLRSGSFVKSPSAQTLDGVEFSQLHLATTDYVILFLDASSRHCMSGHH